MAAFVVFLTLAIAGHDKGFAIPTTLLQGKNLQSEAAAFELGLPKQERGNIYDRNYQLLAGNYRTTAIYARPLEVVDLDLAAKKIGPLLGVSEKELLTTMKSERTFVWIGRKIAPDKAEQISALDLAGIYLIEEMNRIYPYHAVAAHALGFVSKNQGLDGIEFYYDSILRGSLLKNLKLPLRLAPSDLNALTDKGGHLVLTLDLESQKILEEQLAILIEKSGAASGTGLVMDPKTGAILAMASLPDFDPNHFWDFTTKQRCNRTLTSATFPPLPQKAKQSQDEAVADETSQAMATKLPLLIPGKQKKRIRPGQLLSVAADNPLFEMGRYVVNAPVFTVDLPKGSALSSLTPSPASSDSGLDLSPTVASPLQVLSGFVSLANKGRDVVPHLLAGILAPASKRALAAAPLGNNGYLLAPETGERLWLEMAAIGTPGSNNSLFFEHLYNRDSTDLAHGLLLGLAPRENPEMALLFSVNFARTDKASGSSLRSLLDQAGRKVVPRLLKQTRIARPELPPNFWRQEQQLAVGPYRPTGQPNQEGPPPEPEKQHFTMPLVNGKSLRCGLQAIQNIGARVKIIGSGLIVAQQPQAGASISKGELCILKLEAPARD